MASDHQQADDGPFTRIAIMGLGLIGGSIAYAARRRWPGMRIVAIDRRDVIATALQSGAADEGDEDVRACAGCELVVLAAPVQVNIRLLGELPNQIGGPAMVTDVGSTKRQIAETARCVPGGWQFIGGHPVAGAAASGLAAARATLFDGHPWILTPARDRHAAIEPLSRFIEGLGARVHLMTPEAHDETFAYLSHLPQIVASALMHLIGERSGKEGLSLAGPGLHDTTRLAASPADIWREIASTNRDNIGSAIDELIQALTRMKSGGDAIGETFESAARWKRVLEQDREPV